MFREETHMTENQSQHLQEFVEQAIASFNEKEMYLIQHDVSERCICACFAMHLMRVLGESRFSNYSVDVEYNRGNEGIEYSTKMLNNKPITVDLIVHKRGYDRVRGFDNLICIEMKKSTSWYGCDSDEERLEKLVSLEYGFGYKAGFMILINMKKGQAGLEIKRAFFLRGVNPKFCVNSK